MTAFPALVLQIAGCVGMGAMVLRVLGVMGDLTNWERPAWAFAIGYGVLGWLLFFIGVAALYQPFTLFLLLGAGSVGLSAFWNAPVPKASESIDEPLCFMGWVSVAALGTALVFDLMEGLSPPADADSLAYHFAIPKLFLSEGRLIFIERAMDGAVPLLNQLTYIPALSLGGERGLTLWAMASGWGATALLYTACRRYLDRNWSFALAVIFLTTPAVVYGGGSGQVEVRNAMFVIVSGIAVACAVTTGQLKYAVLGGLCVGFFMAGKYIGLLFALACGLAILLQCRWFVHGFVLTAVSFVAGSQWYMWNFVHTGDPFFPMMFNFLDYSAVVFWSADQHASLKLLFLNHEQAVPANVLWLAVYPFVATLSGLRQFESGRTGLGPFVLLVLPFAVAGAWQFRARLRRHPLFIVALICALFYTLWFLTGSSQRIRHLTPALPLVLLVLGVSAHRWSRDRHALKHLMAAVLITLGFQLSGHGLFGLNYVRHLASGETREAFLRRNVHSYDVARWVNQNLTSDDRLYLFYRQLNYLLDVPYFYAHVQQEGWIDIRPEADNPARFYRQLRQRGVTHLLAVSDPDLATPSNGILQWRPLLRAGCATLIEEIDTVSIGSRSLGKLTKSRAYILHLTDNMCEL